MSHDHQPRWVQAFKRNQRYFQAASKILESVWKARDGGLLSRTLAGLTVTGQVVEALYPADSPWDAMQLQELREYPSSIGGWCCEMLLNSRLPVSVIAASLTSQAIVWTLPNGRKIGALFSGGKYSDGPFIDGQDDAEAQLLNTVQTVVWEQGAELSLTLLRTAEWSWRASQRFGVIRMEPLGKYISQRRPEEYAAELRRFPPGPRTCLLLGPTGVGKSVLARHMAKHLNPQASRVLKINSDTLRTIKFDELIAIVKITQPTVLLLDDLNLREEAHLEKFLGIFEPLRDPNCLVVITMMTKGHEKRPDPKPGAWHIEGMRPGRVDIRWWLWYPDHTDRLEILDDYAQEYGLRLSRQEILELASKTENLSGAFLMETMRRIYAYGWDARDEIIETIRCEAPSPDAPEDEKKDEKKERPDLVLTA